MPHVDNFQAEMDFDAITRAAEVNNNPSRLSAMQSMLTQKREALDNALQQFDAPTRNFNGATRSKRNV